MAFKTKVFVFLFCFISGSKCQWYQQSTCKTPTNDIGRCINVFDCQPIMNVINTKLTDELRFQLNKYFCGYNERIPKVCCPYKEIFLQSVDKNLLPTVDCGEAESATRITNGEKADLLEFPWQAALKYISNKPIPYYCGGSLINKNYVLTAAHCINSSIIGVRLGEYNFLTPVDCITIRNITKCAPPHQDFDVTQSDAIVHSNYQKATLGYDIALIRLPRDAVFNEAVKPVCLPINQDLTPKHMKNLFVVGWGHTDYDKRSSVLLKVSVPYQQNYVCNRRVPVHVYNSQFCAGEMDGKDACKGDSGGPIMTAVNVDGRIKAVQVGLVSYGPRYCGQYFPGVYTRLTSYTKWISDNVKP